MKIIKRSYKVYSFDELSPDAKAKVLEDHRDINTDYDGWHDFIIDDWKAKLESYGYSDPEILYSGFWSQGDGACFTSIVDVQKWLKIKKLSNKYRALYKEADNVTIAITHNAHYYHSRTTTVEVEAYGMDEKIQDQADEIGELIAKDLEELGGEIYRDLNKAYDQLNSNESVIETIEANDYQFTGDGTIFS